MPRGAYQNISNVDRNRIINAYEEGRDYLHVATVLGICRQTANGIVKLFQRTGQRDKRPKGGAKNQKVTNDYKELIIAMVEEKPTITLKEIKANLGMFYRFLRINSYIGTHLCIIFRWQR